MSVELYRLSSYNTVATLPPIRPMLNDCTLREGEQSSDASFTHDDRCEIAAALASAGLGRIQVALRKSAPEGNRAVIKAAAGSDTEVLIIAFLPDWRDQIVAAIDAGASHVNIIHRASPPLLTLMGLSPADVLSASIEALQFAHSQGTRVIFSPGDTMRAEWADLERLYASAVEAGAEAVYVLDTVGVATPAAVHEIVQRVVRLTGVDVGIHAHNDLGLALANALAALDAGATIIDTCVNGMGDRCGNPATDEVAVAVDLLYGQPSGVRLDALAELADLVATTSGVAIPPNKPLVGSNAYTHKLDIHVKAMLRDPLAFQPLRPELVGGSPRVAVGKMSGPITLGAKLDELGIAPLNEQETERALLLVDEYAESNKSSVPDDELAAIVETARHLLPDSSL